MTRYVPILRAERARLAGLAALPARAQERLCPLIEVDGPAPGAPAPTAHRLSRGRDDAVRRTGRRADGRGDGHADPLAAYLAGVITDVVAARGPRPVLVDCGPNAAGRTRDGRVALACLTDEARARGAAAVPVVTLGSSDAHRLAAADAAAVDRRGVGVRLRLDDTGDFDTLAERVDLLLDALDVGPSQVDLLVDFAAIAGGQLPLLTVAARATLAAVRRGRSWRSVTLAGAGAAASAGAEWRLWQTLAQAGGSGGAALDFGDYAGLPPEDAADAAAGAENGVAPIAKVVPEVAADIGGAVVGGRVREASVAAGGAWRVPTPDAAHSGGRVIGLVGGSRYATEHPPSHDHLTGARVTRRVTRHLRSIVEQLDHLAPAAA